MNTTPNSSWFYAQNGARKGPVPFLTLQDLFQQGLSPSSLVWTEGMEQWIPASSIPELINSGPVSPYAPPVTDIVPADAQSGFDMNLPQLPVPLDIGFCFRQGWKCTLANFGRFGFFLQAVVEKGLGPFDALKYSWKLTKKNGFFPLRFLSSRFPDRLGGPVCLLCWSPLGYSNDLAGVSDCLPLPSQRTE
jgi:hypothetical protein